MGQQNAIASAPAPQPITENPVFRLEMAAKAYRAMRAAEKSLTDIEDVLRQGELVAASRGVSRADQFAAYTTKHEAQKTLEWAIGVQS